MNRKLRRENNRIRRTQQVMGPKYQAVQLAARVTQLESALTEMIEITKRNSDAETILTAVRVCAQHALEN